ncbi:hypothetical protein R1sor_000934 [Riccia sorocarpa]|uniref:Uncharacterized protein n=1 Tax=Riccia sorocarpa TaxID=122646 RepID=A0ABD3GXP4_9MARC
MSIFNLWWKNFSNFGLEWRMSTMVGQHELEETDGLRLKDLLIHHLLDPMHIEANVTKSLIKRILERRMADQLDMHVKSLEYIQKPGYTDGGVETLPPAPWV